MRPWNASVAIHKLVHVISFSYNCSSCTTLLSNCDYSHTVIEPPNAGPEYIGDPNVFINNLTDASWWHVISNRSADNRDSTRFHWQSFYNRRLKITIFGSDSNWRDLAGFRVLTFYVLSRYGENHILYFNNSGALIGCWSTSHAPLIRYVRLQVAHAPGMPRTFSPPANFKGNC